MAILNRYDLTEATLLNDETIRLKGRRNPEPSYRELLAQEPTAAEKAMDGYLFKPYSVEFSAKGVSVVGIPHGLTTVSGNPITPDVVIPMLVFSMSGPPIASVIPGKLALVNDGSGLATSSGWGADENYVYIAVQGSADDTVLFYVYIEWTHSVIKNEVVTGAYEYIAFGTDV